MNSRTTLAPETRLLLTTRLVRSIGQGVLVVDFALYLKALGWSGTAIGGVLGAGSLFGALTGLLIGPVSDRWGRRPFLLVYEILVAFSGLVAAATPFPLLLTLAAVIGGFGRGASGRAGPFAPAEVAWLSEAIKPDQRGRVFALNTALGFFGMGVGAIIAGLVPLWQGVLPGAAAFRPLFAMIMLANLVNFFILLRTPGGRKPVREAVAKSRAPEMAQVTRTENTALLKLMLVNLTNGMAIGLFGPLTSYWFAVKFGVSASAIGSVFAATFLLTGITALGVGRLSGRMGIVRSVVVLRLIGVVMLVMLPLSPWYWLAALLYILRSALNRATAAPRQALTVGLVRDARRGMATSLNSASMQLPGTLGPPISGWMLSIGQLALPWLLGAALQLLYVGLYGYFFRGYEIKDAGKTPPSRSTAGGGSRRVEPDHSHSE